MSKQFSLSKEDWQSAGKAAIVWFTPVLLVYLSAVLGLLQIDGHHFSIEDLIPSQLVIDGSVFWVLSQIQGILIRWTKGE